MTTFAINGWYVFYSVSNILLFNRCFCQCELYQCVAVKFRGDQEEVERFASKNNLISVKHVSIAPFCHFFARFQE